MSGETSRVRTTVVQRVVVALTSLPSDRQAPTQRLALMYAEAIDDADEADALFRFGPKLHTCLTSLGVRLSDDAPLDPDSTRCWSRLAA